MTIKKQFEFEIEVFLDENDTRLVVRAQAKTKISAWNATRMLADVLFDMALKNNITLEQMQTILNEATTNNLPQIHGAMA